MIKQLKAEVERLNKALAEEDAIKAQEYQNVSYKNDTVMDFS